ncbi:MAG: SAM-dependent methyltransferase [SAR86 cluster bacterium]|uniref:SAM-dependent methyltransferase n=1 Tax=SAR86 cluster bacterium TaxID=2030880 RepID=A0A2A4MVX1_9GAMM|nr:MAG: SAM-dependent methyltransferase [SAR86 cluster bacterium]
MKQSEKFWDRIAERYAKSPIKDEATYQKKLQLTRDYFQEDMNILEFGCGTGSTAIAHSPFVKHILAIDISSKMIEIATSKAELQQLGNIRFQQTTLEELNLPDHSFDLVMGHNILHLLTDKDESIRQVHRLLKPGGIFVSTTACIADSMNFLRFLLPIGKFLRLIPQVTVFSERQLRHSFIQACFEIVYQWQPGKRQSLFIVVRKTS